MSIEFKTNSVVIDGSEYPIYYHIANTRVLILALKHIYEKSAKVTIEGYCVNITVNDVKSGYILSEQSSELRIVLEGISILARYGTYESSPIIYHSKKMTINYFKKELNGITARYDTIYRLLQAIGESQVKIRKTQPKIEVEEPESPKDSEDGGE